MTTQDAMLKLADIIEPSGKHEWRVAPSGKVYRPREGGGPFDWFDPATNDSQAVAVLLWLLSHDTCNELYRYGIVFYPSQARFVEPVRIEHDNTPASFRAAVTKAALRVVS